MTNIRITEDMRFSTWNAYDQRWDVCIPITDEDNLLIGLLNYQESIGWPDGLDEYVQLLEGCDTEDYTCDVEQLNEAELLSAWRTVLRTYERDF